MIPQDINPTTTGPQGGVPAFLPESFPPYLLPPVLTLTRQGTTDAALTPPCHCRLEFDGLVVQENPAVALEARWFIDYDTANPSSTRVWTSQKLDPVFSDVTQTTRTLAPFLFDADDRGITTSGIHIVEVVVGEFGGFDDSSTTLPNRAMRDGFVPAVYRFAVQVNLEQVVGQCPRTPPSHPVCG